LALPGQSPGTIFIRLATRLLVRQYNRECATGYCLFEHRRQFSIIECDIRDITSALSFRRVCNGIIQLSDKIPALPKCAIDAFPLRQSPVEWKKAADQIGAQQQ
jgi:hypothetical protein